MADIFREVDEDLRREKLERAWRRFGPLIMGIALLIVVGTMAFVGWQRWQAGAAEERTAALLRALDAARPAGETPADPAAAAAGLASGIADLTGNAAVIARMQAAGLVAEAGDKSGAAEMYAAIAAAADTPDLLRDLARLLNVLHRMETDEAEALRRDLLGLTIPGNPWRFTARELDGLLAARMGAREEAQSIFRQLSDDPQAPAGIRSRAAELAALYAATPNS